VQLGVRLRFKKFEHPEANPEALPEGIDPDDYIITTYYMSFPKGMNPFEITQILALEQSTGTWLPVPGETPEVRKKHVAKVIGVFETPDYELMVPNEVDWRNYIVQIAFPWENMGSRISMLLSTVVGNISMAPKLKVLDIRFPEKYLKGFRGPKFGIEGVREVLGVKERPILNNMIKPDVYSPPDLGAQLAYEVARGGVDIIKDDELLANPSFNTLEERVPKFMEAIDKANEEKGEKTLYAVNITADLPEVLENADKVIELGANCLLVNYLATGFPVLKALAEDESVKVPIMAHMDVAGAYYVSPISGIRSTLILGKLPRICGADIVVYPAPYGKAPMMEEKYVEVAKNHRYPLYHIKPCFPMPSGGISPSNVPRLISTLGYDIVVAAGGGIHAHPDGPAAGARAFRQAIDAVMQGYMDLRKYAEENNLPELLKALQL
jgi:2,3-diketo-5-methylthiopentyl-1-phosphate enolase